MLVSLCIPTNGILEWVIPVLDSIYNQNIDNDLFEVVIADNGNNIDFYYGIKMYLDKFDNLIYKHTNATGFLNQIECFDMASGEFIKFINHRMPLINGALEKFINIARNYRSTKPIVFFTNGTMPSKKTLLEFTDFDNYISCIGYMSSWSGGTAIWRNDFKKEELKAYNRLFPHIKYVLSNSTCNLYLVDNTKIFYHPQTDETKKGNYKLYQAFGLELPMIFFDIKKKNMLKQTTYKKVLKQIEKFLAIQYCELELEKKPCSYDLSDFTDYVSIFFNPHKIIIMAYIRYLKRKTMSSLKNVLKV